MLDKETNHHKSSQTEAFNNFIKSVLGIGITAIPYTAQKVGSLWAVPLMIIVLFCCYKSTIYLLEIVDKEGDHELLYNDVVKITLQGSWPQFIDIIMVINQITLCIAYILFFTRFIETQLIYIGLNYLDFFAFLVALLPIFPLTMINNIHFFNRTSAVGMGLGIIGIVITILYGFSLLLEKGNHLHFKNPIKMMMKDSFAFIGVGINCFEGIPTVLPIRNSMSDPQKFKNVFQWVMLVTFIFVLLIQQLMSLFFGDHIASILVFSVQNFLWQSLAAGCYCISILLTYPLQIYPATQIIEKNLTGYTQENSLWIKSIQQFIVRATLTLIIFGIAFVTPNFAAFLDLIGSVFGALLQYLFPCLMHILYFRNSIKQSDYISYIVIIGFSTFTIIFGFYTSLMEML